MVATTVSRWSGYDEYLRFLAQLIDRARQLSTQRWTYARNANYIECDRPADESGTGNKTVSCGDPFSKDELAWLYNEAGLAYYGAGAMVDAIGVWEQSYEINRLLDRSGNGHYVFQSLCNLGAAHIHFGHLQKAESYLLKALEMGQSLHEPDHVARIRGYVALLSHLRGNLAEANDGYKEVAEVLKDMGNLRAYSIVLRHHADLLLRGKGTRREAWNKIQASKAVAEANSYEDLAAYARLSFGHLHRLEKRFDDAIREYRLALELARMMGIRRLEAEAQSELARVDLELGDAHVARRRAMKALQIANECLLGLRQTHGLVILGRATVRAGERELGMHYLRHAKRLANRQEYRLRASEAEAELDALGERVENSDVEATGTRYV
jgi:tetratricopeptide (TPR) repeat protein